MKRPTFSVIEKETVGIVLVVDKKGDLGNLVTEEIHQGHIVFVSHKQVEKPSLQNIAFSNAIPKIPDYRYSHMILFYYGEKEMEVIILQCIEKAKRDDARVVVVIDLLYARERVIEKLKDTYTNIRIVVFGDYFGLVTSPTSTIDRFIHETKTTGKINVVGDGLEKTFSVAVTDVILETLRITFGKKATEKVFLLFPKHAPTQLSLARTIQAVQPSFTVDFVAKNKHPEEEKENSRKMTNSEILGAVVLPLNYPLRRKLLEADVFQEPLPHKQKAKVVKLQKRRKKNPFSFLFFFVFLVSIFLLSPLLVTALFGGIGFFSVTTAKNAFLSGDFAKAKTYAQTAENMFALSQTTEKIVEAEAGLFNMYDKSTFLSEKLSLGKDGSFAILHLSQASEKLLLVFAKKSKNPETDMQDGLSEIKKTLVTVQKMQAEYPDVLAFTGSSESISMLGGIIDTLPQLAGFSGKKTYAILFQNNMELRPAGGFIGSYGLVSLDKATLSPLVINDVYTADGQLKGHVEPPYPIRRFIPMVHLYLRDSNFYPDFPTAASSSANMLLAETGQSVNGVLAIDVTSVRFLIQALGSVYVPDYKETVTADNFYLLTQSHAEKNFFPGSTQKKDFLRALFLAIEQKISSGNFSTVAVAKAMLLAISQKHILLAVPYPAIQNVLSANNISGTISETREEKTNTVNDFLEVSEANIGSNKANAFLQRKVEQKVLVTDDNKITETVTVRYKNNSSLWPGGDYKNYVEFIVPKGSTLTSISIDGTVQKITPAVTVFEEYEHKGFVPPKGLEVETKEQNGRTSFGFLIIVPKQTFKIITVSYTLPHVFNDSLSYNLWYFKQPGTENYPYVFSAVLPKTMGVLSTENSSDLSSSLLFEKDILQDVRLSFTAGIK